MSKCEGCNTEISSPKVVDFSKKKYGKILCMDCQRKEVSKKADSQTKPVVNSSHGLKPEHIISLQGKQFVTHAGLLEKAHEIGLSTIRTELLTPIETIHTAKMIVFKAVVVIAKGDEEPRTFTGYGDATKENVNSVIFEHRLRMAETRAVNRALRFSTNIGMCSVDELGGYSKKLKKLDADKKAKKFEEDFNDGS